MFYVSHATLVLCYLCFFLPFTWFFFASPSLLLCTFLSSGDATSAKGALLTFSVHLLHLHLLYLLFRYDEEDEEEDEEVARAAAKVAEGEKKKFLFASHNTLLSIS